MTRRFVSSSDWFGGIVFISGSRDNRHAIINIQIYFHFHSRVQNKTWKTEVYRFLKPNSNFKASASPIMRELRRD